MANRKFTDRAGQQWEVRDRSSAEWILEPVLGNPGTPRRIKPPGYEQDPFELSEEELRGLLERSDVAAWPSTPRKSPFLD